MPALVRTGTLLMLALGLVGGAVAGVLSPWLVGSALNIEPGLEAEALRSLDLLATSIPLVVTTAG